MNLISFDPLSTLPPAPSTQHHASPAQDFQFSTTMSKPKSKSKSPASGPKTYNKSTKGCSESKPPSKSGLDEIDTLFASKKQSNKLAKQEIQQQEQIERLERQKRKEARLEEEADEIALRGGSVSSSGAVVGRRGDAVAPQALHAKAVKLGSLSYTRDDLAQLNKSDTKQASNEQKSKWASDGLGGVFNGEGYTGRKDEGGHRVFKAHLMNKEGFGMSKDCPFDCDCCYI
eukprot:scaffold91094_cov75-Cyclotella_meneghiniana.AAC.9